MNMPRSRTPSNIKWLANELAATAGALDRIDAELALLQAQRARLVSVRSALVEVAEMLAVPRLAEAVPPVRAADTFGARGNLRNYIRGALQAAHPAALDTVSLAKSVAAHFGLTFASPRQQQRFRHHSVTRTLHKLLARDEVERVADPMTPNPLLPRPTAAGIWRWKVHAPPLSELHRLQQAEC
jgi:hypothetical protein